jgi:hypothetical protein
MNLQGPVTNYQEEVTKNTVEKTRYVCAGGHLILDARIPDL